CPCGLHGARGQAGSSPGGEAMTPLSFGLTLPTRGVLFGVETMADLLDMGQEADESGLFQSLWVGDSILAKRRPESVSLLSALAARTKKVRLAVGCMASFPVRHPVLLAAQWAALDQIAGPGRALLAACIGGEGGGGDWQMENDAFGVPQGERIGRMVEGIKALKALWTQERATFEGKYYSFKDIISEPRPVTKPRPAIRIAANARPSRNADIWVAYGPPEEVIGKVREFADAGAKEITFRITSFEQRRQYQRLVKEILPAFERVAVA